MTIFQFVDYSGIKNYSPFRTPFGFVSGYAQLFALATASNPENKRAEKILQFKFILE